MYYNFIALCIAIILALFSFLFLGVIMFNTIETRKSEPLTIENTQPQLTSIDKIKYTNELFDLIDELIQLELLNRKRFEIFLNEPNKNLDVDQVLKDISTSVYVGLSSDVIIAKDCVVTQDYIMRYIQKKTFIAYFTYLRNNVSDQD